MPGGPGGPDEREQRELHRLEIDLDRPGIGEDARTVQHDTTQAVHLGELGVARRSIRIVAGSVRRLIARVAALEEHAATLRRGGADLLIVFVAGILAGTLLLGVAELGGMVVVWWLL